jgi:hypothetical protein
MSTATAIKRYRTGEKCEISGRYDFDGYLDGMRYPQVRTDEKRIRLAKSDSFPPIRSAGKGCYWRLAERH